jgi:hypothetical protein
LCSFAHFRPFSFCYGDYKAKKGINTLYGLT